MRSPLFPFPDKKGMGKEVKTSLQPCSQKPEDCNNKQDSSHMFNVPAIGKKDKMSVQWILSR